MITTKSFLLVIMLCASLVFFAGCGDDDEGSATTEKADLDKTTVAEGVRHAVPADYKNKPNPEPGDNASIAEGKKLFTANCVTCHGEDGKGQTEAGKAVKAADLTDPSVMGKVGDDYIYWRISEGGTAAPFKSAMLPFKDKFSSDQRWQLVNYIRTLKH